MNKNILSIGNDAKTIKGGNCTLDKEKFLIVYSLKDKGYRAINKETILNIKMDNLNLENPEYVDKLENVEKADIKIDFGSTKLTSKVQSIIDAKPTDGLWEDGRSDEDQIGASYPELEWAMDFKGDTELLSVREKEVLAIYKRMNRANKHKMIPIPICEIPEELKA